MNTNTQFQFLTSKINELETAVFHSQSNSVLNLYPTVIKHLKIDDKGYIWFLMNKPLQEIREFEKQFPFALIYYKKGASFYINVYGVARIVIDPEELVCADLDHEIKNGLSSDKILLNVKIANVNYYEREVAANKSWLAKFKKAFMKLFLPEDAFYYNPSLENDRNFA